MGWLQTNNRHMAVALRSTQILLRFTAQIFAMRQPLGGILVWARKQEHPRLRQKGNKRKRKIKETRKIQSGQTGIENAEIKKALK